MSEETTSAAKKGAHLRTAVKTTGLFVSVLILLSYGVSLAWAYKNQDRLGPNTWIGSVSVSGKTQKEALNALQKETDTILTNGLTVELLGPEKKHAKLPLATVTDGDILEYVSFDLEKAIEKAHLRTHGKYIWLDGINAFLASINSPAYISIPVTLNQEKISEALAGTFPNDQKLAQDAQFSFTKQGTTWTTSIIPGQEGSVFALGAFFPELTEHLSQLDTRTISINLEKRPPTVTELQAEPAAKVALNALLMGPIKLEYKESETADAKTWEISTDAIAGFLTPSSNSQSPITINRTNFEKALSFKTEFEQPAQNARFSVVDGRVEEFAPSEPGVAIDIEVLSERIVLALNTRTTETASTPIAVPVMVTEPQLKTEEVNSLGITEMLGTGTSSYRGSPSNRIKNIRNGVRLLNGLLIAPGETLSLVEKLAPFTLGNGYLPELVIKGDRIEPEIGGGLCQIGTTTFRATMNSGLAVEERRNHSLVVSYYNDPSNNNPGTDATIYEPSPDYKFKNDTPSYVLFQAEMIESTQDLRFTFWGTSDGRKASYTPPVVHSWIATGPVKEVVSENIAPGARKCQEAHPGANTSFTYMVNYADGTEHKEVFESHYRALPKICLVGPTVATPTAEETLGEPAI